MQTSPFRSRVFVGSLLVGALMAAACTVKEVDDETPAGSGGSLSSAGTGGTTAAGTGGTAGIAGTGGIAGAGGIAGTGGVAGTAGTAGAAGTGVTGGAGGATLGEGLVRFAHMSADVGIIDVCLRAQGEEWTTYPPVFRENGVGDQWGFPRVSRTVPFYEGSYEVRVIDASAADCSVPKAGVVDQMATVKTGQIHTIALMGRASALAIKSFTSPAADAANLTFHVINGLTNQEPATEVAFIDSASPANTTSLASGLKGFTDKVIVTADPAAPVKIAAIVDDGLPAVTVIASVPDVANVDPVKGYYATDELLPGDRFELLLVGSKAGETDAQLVPEAIICGVTADGREVVQDPATGNVVDGPFISDYCTYGSLTK